MKSCNKVLFGVVCAVAALGLSVVSSQANLLTNPGLETGDLTGWTPGGPGGSVSASTDYANSGSYSLLLDATGAGAWTVPEATQTFAASPGQEYNLNGYALSDGWTDASFGLLKIVFRDAGDVDLDGGIATIGTWVGPGNPGAESGQITSATPVGEWNFLEVQAIAPASTAKVLFLALNVNQGIDDQKMYFDDLSATLIPEPTTFALAGLGALMMAFRRRR